MPDQKIGFDLNLGYPDVAAIPKETLAGISGDLLRAGRGLQYGGDLKGVQFAREQVARFLNHVTGDPVDVPNLMLTCGSLQGIDVACRSLCEPGDVVLVEGPTFFFAINLLQMSHVKLVSVPLCQDGIDLDQLQNLIKQFSPRLFYTIPTFQNPTGICASAENRKRLVALAQQHDFILLEDTAYQYLYFESPAPPMLHHYDQGRGHVVTVGTFSKLIAPSLRQGWIWATPEQIDLFVQYKSDASASLLTCEVLSEYLKRGLIDDQIHFLQNFYRGRCACMASALQKHFPEWVSWTIPKGGFFVWAELPEYLSAKQLRALARERGADFMPGQACFIEPVADRFVRLCFAYVDEKAIEAGIEIIGSGLREINL